MANLIGAAYKWRIDNNVYSYITNTEGGDPFVVSGSTECNEELIRNKVQNFTKEQYEAKFQEMVSAVHAYNNGKYSYVQFLDYTIYMNEAEHCDIYNRPDVVTDVDFTVCATTLPSDSEATVEIYTTDEDIECREGEKIRKYHIDFGIPKGSRFIQIRVTDEELSQNGEQIIRENDILPGDFVVSVDSNTIWSCSRDYQFITSGVQLNGRTYRYFTDINAYSFGENDIAKGINSITEGYATVAGYEGSYNQIEDIGEDIAGYYSHAEGNATAAAGSASHTEGKKTYASGIASHAEGYNTFASGTGAHAEGQSTQSIASKSHAEGYHTEASGECSHAEGNYTKATGANSHSEGLYTESNGANSHSEGSTTIADGISAHAEGNNTKAIANGSHAEGSGSIGSGPYSHVEGGYNTTYGECSHAEGSINIAYGAYSHVEGKGNVAKNIGQHVSGTYAEIDETNNAIFQVGIGTNDSTRKDAFRINKDGSFVFAVSENADAPIFTFNPSVAQQEASAINENEGDGDSVQTYNMRRSAARQTSVAVTTSNFIDLINLQDNINNAINGIEFPITQDDLDDLKEDLSEDFEAIIDEQENNYNESIAEILSKTSDIQSQIDGEATAWFLEGEPCDKWGTIDTNKEPAKDWNEDGTNGKESYASHKGDTYTDITEQENGEIGKSWRFCYCERKTGEGENDKVTDWHWHEIGDASVARALYEASRAQSTADGKSTVYISRNEDGNRVPDHYQAGDMWIINDIALEHGEFDHDEEKNIYYTKESDGQGGTQRGTPISVGEMLTANANSKEYDVTHWSKEIKYTDDSYAIEAKNRADEAYDYAESGHTEALKAIELLNGISSDGRVYPSEFKELTLKIETINSEKVELVGQDGTGGEASLWEAGVDSADDYFNAANSAITALRYYTDENNFEVDAKTQTSLGYIQILNSDENISHPGYWGNITNYYVKRQELLNDIADASKKYADEIQGIAEEAADRADSAIEAANSAAIGASAALGILDDVDNDDVVAITEFAALESELEVIERDLIEIQKSIELYQGSDLYNRLKSATAKYEITGTTVTYTGYATYQTAQTKAVNALKYHCGKTITKDGVNVTAGEADKNEHDSIIIRTSKKNNAITTPFEIDYENIVDYYGVRQSMLEHIAFVAKLYAESLQTELSPENVAAILGQIKIDGVNLVTGSRCDFTMSQWGSTEKLTTRKNVNNDYTETTINADSKLSFCTYLYDKITNKQWEGEYISASIDVFIPKDNVTEEDEQNPKKVNFGIVLRNGLVNLFSAYTTNIECVYNDWTRLKLTFPMENDVTDVFTKDGKEYLVTQVYLVVYDSDSTYTAGTTFKFRKIQIEFNTSCSSWYPSPEDIDEIYSVAVDAQQNANSAKEAAEESMSILTDMSDDGKLTPQEKVDIRKEWGEIQEEYEQALSDVQRAWRDHGFTDPQEYNDYESAYDCLDDCLALIDIDGETTTDISTISGTIFSVTYTGREYFNKAFSTYYAKHVGFMNCLAEQLAYLEVRSVEIGAVNLLDGTETMADWTPRGYSNATVTKTSTNITSNGKPATKIQTDGGSDKYKAIYTLLPVSKIDFDREYTLSFDVEAIDYTLCTWVKLAKVKGDNTHGANRVIIPSGKSKRVSFTGYPYPEADLQLWFGAEYFKTDTTANTYDAIFKIRNLKLEFGSVATEWTPSLNDTKGYIDEVKNYTDTIKNSLQNQIDGVVDSYFMEGEPTTTNKPASDWNVGGTNGKESYAHHEGDTYTNVEDAILLDSSMWEQGSIVWHEEVSKSGANQESDYFVRTDYIDVEGCSQLLRLASNYYYTIFYYDSNKSCLRVDPVTAEGQATTTHLQILKTVSNKNVAYFRLRLGYVNGVTNKLKFTIDDAIEAKAMINPTAGQSWRWCPGNESGETSGWHWHKIADSDAIKALQAAAAAQDTADGKRRVFTGGNGPNPPYDVGDLWVTIDANNSSLNDTLYCKNQRTSGSYVSTDWESSTAAMEAYNKASSALTAAENVDFLTSVMQSGATETKGGLFLTNVLALRDINNTDVTGGMSGVVNDKVLLWGGGTYEDAAHAAINNYLKTDDSNKITTLIKKDGTGKIGAFYIDEDTVKVVTNTNTIIITNQDNTNYEFDTISLACNGATYISEYVEGGVFVNSNSTCFSGTTNKTITISNTVNFSRSGNFKLIVDSFDVELEVSGYTAGVTNPVVGEYLTTSINSITYILKPKNAMNNSGALVNKTFTLSRNNSISMSYGSGGWINNVKKTCAVSEREFNFDYSGVTTNVFVMSVVVNLTSSLNTDMDQGRLTWTGNVTIPLFNVQIASTEKYTIFSKSGISIIDGSNNYFHINNTDGMEIKIKGLPKQSSANGLSSGQLYMNNSNQLMIAP